MPGTHAKFAPSAAKRWMACPGSIRMSEGVEDTSSPAADRGTAAHAVLAACMEDPTRDPKSFVDVDYHEDGMSGPVTINAEDVAAVERALGYIRKVQATLRPAVKDKNPRTLVETKVNPRVAPDGECEGTVDIGMIGSGVLEVVDYKHGSGVRVDPDDPQLLLYALGMLKECDPPEAQRIKTTILQPRYDRANEWARSLEWMPDQLLQFKLEVEGAIKAASAPDAPLVPGEVQCQWCPAKATCPALQEKALEAAQGVFSEAPGAPPPVAQPEAPPWQEVPLAAPQKTPQLDPSLFAREPDGLDVDGIRRILEAEPLIRSWLTAVHDHAHMLAMSGERVPGWKLVSGRGSYTLDDESEVKVTLAKATRSKDHGGGKLKKADYIVESLLSPAQIRKQLKPILTPVAWKKVEAHLHRVDGKPVLVPETDSRPEVVRDASRVFEPAAPTPSSDMSFLE